MRPDPNDLADTIMLAQVILIALLVAALILLTPVAHPEWFAQLDTSGPSETH